MAWLLRKSMLFLQQSPSFVPRTPKALTTTCKSSCRVSNILLWSLHVYGTHKFMQLKHSYTIFKLPTIGMKRDKDIQRCKPLYTNKVQSSPECFAKLSLISSSAKRNLEKLSTHTRLTKSENQQTCPRHGAQLYSIRSSAILSILSIVAIWFQTADQLNGKVQELAKQS